MRRVPPHQAVRRRSSVMTTTIPGASTGALADAQSGVIKCLVWDLDNTLWTGVLMEDDDVRVRPEVVDTIAALDSRGILQSIASRNDPEVASARLQRFGLLDYFVHPQIGWTAKSS